MVTPDEAYEVAMDAAEAQRLVRATCRDGAVFDGKLEFIHIDYLLLTQPSGHQLGFPLTEIDLEVIW